jgi:hypothetical protein
MLVTRWPGGEHGNTWTWPPIIFFGPPSLPFVFSTLWSTYIFLQMTINKHPSAASIPQMHRIQPWQKVFHLCSISCQYGCIRVGDVLVTLFARLLSVVESLASGRKVRVHRHLGPPTRPAWRAPCGSLDSCCHWPQRWWCHWTSSISNCCGVTILAS